MWTKAMRPTRWGIHVLLLMTVSLISLVNAETTVFLDSIDDCNKRHTIYNSSIVIRAHKSKVLPNPLITCNVIIDGTDNTDSNVVLEITQTSVSITDCGFVLDIYDGEDTSSSPLKSVSCWSRSTGVLYTRGKIVMFYLHRPMDLFQPTNDFSMKVNVGRIEEPDDDMF
ncbi:uncharacterized protein LOC117341938 [Pecten maximus]|uniref:uncharacterized protein LOC117341938 n=1 Tax=Pecten maximus TaxID=6579 RepID=UPI0014590324|nr:uncharacterized protein LOC117341938 [Pecten maximus]XP_033759706.1 uncharacterized protein LOC117341938 [Pecten maximus]